MPRETRVRVGVGYRGETSVGVEARDWRRFEAMSSAEKTCKRRYIKI